MRRLIAIGCLVFAQLALAEEQPKRPFGEQDASAGKALYLRECSACHGDRGDGQGPATNFVDPRPRDFTKRMFKLRTTPSGEAPTTQDVFRTIERGIPGSAMPSFAFLPEGERKQIAAYVLRVADLLDEPEPKPIPDPGTAPPTTTASIARGKQLYEQMQCGSCHGPLGKGDGPAARTQKDDDGRPIKVRDFTGGVFRGGGDRRDLYYRFTTGMDGSPMPSYGESVSGDDRWALVDYVMSLKVTPPGKPLPSSPILAGRKIADKYSCRGCHVLDDGKGGAVGPDLRVSGQKLSTPWIRDFLRAPRDYGTIYPWRVWRMPHLGITVDEAKVLANYISAMGHRKPGPVSVPDAKAFPTAKLEEGQLMYMLRCTECHALGKVIETPAVKQQGPDLIHVAGRIDYEWAKKFIFDPKKIYPSTKMTVPGITPDQAGAIGMFIWKASIEFGSNAVVGANAK